MKREENGTSSAIVQFETEAAAKTALLLTSALIVDRPITVIGIQDQQPTNDNTQQIVGQSNAVPQSSITQRNYDVPDEQRSKTSVIASLLASGYILASDAAQTAKEIDEKHMISLQAKVAMEQIKVKAYEIDKQYGISEKASAIGKSVSDTAKKIDEGFGISEKASQAAQTVKQTYNTTSQKMAENLTVKKGVDSVKSAADTVNKSVNTLANDLKEQTNKAIEEKQKEKDAKRKSSQGPVPVDPNTNVNTIPVPTATEQPK